MKVRRFRFIEAGVDIGGFDVEGETEDLPEGWRELVEAADTEMTFTFEMNGERYLGVSIKEVTDEI